MRAQNQVMGEVKFEGTTEVEKKAGVWVDGLYVGYLKELKGNKKIMLLPGEHEIAVRQSGYDDFIKKVVVEPGASGTGGVLPYLPLPQLDAARPQVDRTNTTDSSASSAAAGN